jgi:hypothetical protein
MRNGYTPCYVCVCVCVCACACVCVRVFVSADINGSLVAGPCMHGEGEVGMCDRYAPFPMCVYAFVHNVT